ncbi:MAG TPA: hypothetical protein VGJ04_01745 [Pirellulales bacterium]|jgi:hypothetical protein
MNEKERNKFQRIMRKFDSKAKAKVDLALIELREMYEHLSSEERHEIRAWLDQVADANEMMPRVGINMSMKIEFSEQIGEDEYRTVQIPILAFKRAFESWDRGEFYTPTTFGELV